MIKDAFADPELQSLLAAFGGRMLEVDETRLLAERLTIGAVDVLLRDPRLPKVAARMFADPQLRQQVKPLADALMALAAAVPRHLGGLGAENDLNPLAAHVFKAMTLNAPVGFVMFVTPATRARIRQIDRRSRRAAAARPAFPRHRSRRAAMTSTPFLSMINLSIVTPTGLPLVQNTSFQVGRGEFVLLIGPSGSGKTSIVNLLCGLLGEKDGDWRISGQIVCAGRRIDLAHETSDLSGLVFQGNALFDDLSAAENVRIAADHAPGRNAALIDAVIALLPDIDPRASIAACSGGQRQRLAIARTLLSDRPVLVLDEPNSGLDVRASRRLAGLVKEICRESGKPAIIVAHHVEDLLPLADRVLLLDTSRRIIRPIEPTMRTVEREMMALDPTAAVAAVPVSERDTPWRRRLRRRPRSFWFARYFGEYFWVLCLSPFALAYIGVGGAILGFVSIWFGFNYHSFGGYLKSILHDETLAGIGFVQTTVAVPLDRVDSGHRAQQRHHCLRSQHADAVVATQGDGEFANPGEYLPRSLDCSE